MIRSSRNEGWGRLFWRDAAIPELRPLLDQLRAKMTAGSRTEEALADELGKLDALIGKYATKPASAADLSLTKAMIYLQVFGQPAKARELIVAITEKYPDTEAAKNAKDILGQLGEPAPTPPAEVPATVTAESRPSASWPSSRRTRSTPPSSRA